MEQVNGFVMTLQAQYGGYIAVGAALIVLVTSVANMQSTWRARAIAHRIEKDQAVQLRAIGLMEVALNFYGNLDLYRGSETEQAEVFYDCGTTARQTLSTLEALLEVL